MKLYKISTTGQTPHVTRWVGTQADAAATRKEFNSRLHVPRDNIVTEEVDVPTTKQELLAWLNGNNS